MSSTRPWGGEPRAADWPGYARHRRSIAGCDRCRAHLLSSARFAGFTPMIAFTTDDYVAVQALVTADLGVLGPSPGRSACARPATQECGPSGCAVPAGASWQSGTATRRDPPAVSLLMEVLRAAAVPPPRSAGRVAATATPLSYSRRREPGPVAAVNCHPGRSLRRAAEPFAAPGPGRSPGGPASRDPAT